MTSFSVLRSSVGKKVIVAISGLGLFLFVLVHMLGTMTFHAGRESMVRYAEALRAVPGVLWFARIGLVAAFGIHAALSLQLAAKNRRAGGLRSRSPHGVGQNRSRLSRAMVWTGPAILLFTVLHVAHMTLKWFPGLEAARDVFEIVRLSFANPVVALLYILGTALLVGHLHHGLWSALQSMGLRHERYFSKIRTALWTTAVVIGCGYATVPIASWLGG